MITQRAILFAGTAALLVACGDDPVAPTPPPPPANPAGPAATRTRRPANATPDAGVIPQMPITEGTFVEAAMVRDPFRNYSAEFINTGVRGIVDTRDVRLSNYSLDDLRLVAVIVGTDNPYAMVTDPSRAGTILRRGNYVARQEIIHSNVEGRSDYAVHWRVTRINGARYRRLADGSYQEIPAELVFERPDPLNPVAAPVERVLALSQQSAGGPSAAPGMPIPVTSGPPTGASFLPPSLGAAPAPGAPSAPGASNGQGSQQTVTYITPPPNPAPPPTTVVVQAPPAQPPLVVPPSNTPPPVQVNSGQNGGGGALPLHGVNK